jgi:hypothetical protein
MPNARESELSKKLNLKKGMKARVVRKPADVNLSGVAITPSPKAEAIIVFVRTVADLEADAGPVVDAAKEDRIAWLVYPKAGKLDTDLNRDILWKHMLKKDAQGVRQIAIDDVWSAMRFRPKR